MRRLMPSRALAAVVGAAIISRLGLILQALTPVPFAIPFALSLLGSCLVVTIHLMGTRDAQREHNERTAT